jgi:hypothetical protein
MVCPPTFSAATPVGAQINTCLEVFQARWFSSVDFPVPARPVTKMCSRVFSMASKTAACSGDRGSAVTASKTTVAARTRPVRDLV